MRSIKVCSDVVEANLILEKKEKYTMRDVKNVMMASLFNPVNGETIDLELAVFIVKCSAVFHNTEYSDSLNISLNKLRKYSIT